MQMHIISIAYVYGCPRWYFVRREQTNQPNDLQLFDLFFGIVFEPVHSQSLSLSLTCVRPRLCSRIHLIRHASKFCFSFVHFVFD